MPVAESGMLAFERVHPVNWTGVLLVFGARCQLKMLARQEHGRTIPLAGIALHRHVAASEPY